MQAFGIGLPELLLVLVLTVLVVGPERLPEVAAQIARFIRRARSYAEYVARDFNDVVAELEKEVGTSREDLKEIATFVGGSTAALAQELDKVGAEARDATDLQKLDREISPPNVVPIDAVASRHNGERDATAVKEESEAGSDMAAQEQEEDKSAETWFVPGTRRRRRSANDGI